MYDVMRNIICDVLVLQFLISFDFRFGVICYVRCDVMCEVFDIMGDFGYDISCNIKYSSMRNAVFDVM